MLQNETKYNFLLVLALLEVWKLFKQVVCEQDTLKRVGTTKIALPQRANWTNARSALRAAPGTAKAAIFSADGVVTWRPNDAVVTLAVPSSIRDYA